MSDFNPDQAEMNFRNRVVREHADSLFTDKWMDAALKAEQEDLRNEANLNNDLYRADLHRMEDHRASNVTFSDVQIAEMTSPR